MWLTQKMMAELFDAEVQIINYHLKEIFKSLESKKHSVIRKIRITARDGKTVDVTNIVLPFQIIETVNEPRLEESGEPKQMALFDFDERGRWKIAVKVVDIFVFSTVSLSSISSLSREV